MTAIRTGAPQLISVMPQDVIDKIGISVGDEYEGKKVSKNGCPSEGTVDIFIEPHTPPPQLVIYGKAPVAEALKNLAPQFGWAVKVAKEDVEPSISSKLVVIVVATQGNNDLKSLKKQIKLSQTSVTFVELKSRLNT